MLTLFLHSRYVLKVAFGANGIWKQILIPEHVTYPLKPGVLTSLVVLFP